LVTTHNQETQIPDAIYETEAFVKVQQPKVICDDAEWSWRVIATAS